MKKFRKVNHSRHAPRSFMADPRFLALQSGARRTSVVSFSNIPEVHGPALTVTVDDTVPPSPSGNRTSPELISLTSPGSADDSPYLHAPVTRPHQPLACTTPHTTDTNKEVTDSNLTLPEDNPTQALDDSLCLVVPETSPTLKASYSSPTLRAIHHGNSNNNSSHVFGRNRSNSADKSRECLNNRRNIHGTVNLSFESDGKKLNNDSPHKAAYLSVPVINLPHCSLHTNTSLQTKNNRESVVSETDEVTMIKEEVVLLGFTPLRSKSRETDETPTAKTPLGKQELYEKRETMFFRDGKRRIDYVMAYRGVEDEERVEIRKTFEANLIEEGLELEHENRSDGKTGFVKVHAPWDVLTRVAELLAYKMPIKEYDESLINEGCCAKLPNPFKIEEGVIPEEPEFFTADFSCERERMFIIKDHETFFTNSQRSAIVHELLLRTKYEPEKEKFGIDRLIRRGVYTSAFPLHEGPYTSEHSILTTASNDRHLLYETWARPGRWYCYQPVDLIRKYFGEKVGIYFTWLGFYTSMLIPASVVGLIVFIYGCATLFHNAPSEEICSAEGPGNFTMCPLCDKRCTFWKLESSCMYSRLTYLFDNSATVFFAGFMAIWAMVFLEIWKRKNAEIQYEWDVADFDMEEHMRPDFEARCKHRRMNPVTQLMEPFLPLYSKLPRLLTSFTVVAFMICCVLGAVFGVIVYRMVIVGILYAAPNSTVREYAKITTTCTAALLSLVIIMLLNKVYEKVAFFLTELERPKTDSDYEDSFTLKMFLFQFVNFYGTLFYIAFFKGRIGATPVDTDYSLGIRPSECDPAGCLIELCIQLGIIMIGKQAFNNFKEIMLPKILNWFRSRTAMKNETEENLYTRWEQDNDLAQQPPLGLFDEYLEMVIQYGFVTIFVAAFPLAPLFALINNVIEIRLDAYKFVTQWKRPVALRAQDIGIWYGILRGVTFLAVLSNAFIIGWTSDFVPKMVYKYVYSPGHSLDGYIDFSQSYFNVSDFQEQSIPDNNMTTEYGLVTYCRYSGYRQPAWSPDKYEYTAAHWHIFCARLAFVIVFEHVVFFLTWLVAYIIPDVPAQVKKLMLRELYLAKEARYQAAFSTLHDDRREKQESLNKMA